MNGHYYNEFDPDMAAWLRVLIAERLIPAGDVDERSIVDVKATELRGYVQHHLFAGLGGWPFALRLAGWPADRPVATCSCPCPPFSAAGKKKACPQCAGTNPMPHVGRTGYFVCCLCGHEWFADERHLWPEAWRIIRELRPVAIYGEQVASGDGRVWLAGVRASLQILGYDCGGADLCSSIVLAPNIRQRLFWLAESQSPGEGRRRIQRPGESNRATEQRASEELAGRGANGCWMGEPIQQGLEGHAGNGDDGSEPGRHGETAPRPTAETGDAGGVAKSNERGRTTRGRTEPQGAQPESGNREPEQRSGIGGMEHSLRDRREQRGTESGGRLAAERCSESGMDDASSKRASDQHAGQTEPSGDGENNGVSRAAGCQGRVGQPEIYGHEGRSLRTNREPTKRTEEAGVSGGWMGQPDSAGPQPGREAATTAGHGYTTEPAGFWSDAIWHLCRDGKQRRIPLESAFFPLAAGLPGRVAMLKGFGNAINPQIAAEFINATK